MSRDHLRGTRAPLLTNVIIAVAACLLALAVLEIGVRLAPPGGDPLNARLLWEAQMTQLNAAEPAPLRVGGYEFHEGPVPAAARQEPYRRLLFIGDSFTRGQGVPRHARFSDLIEDRLNATSGAARRSERVHVFNAGVDGSNPEDWVGYLDAMLPDYRPHAVITVFFLRDGTILPTSLRLNKKLLDPIREKWQRMPFYHWSALLRLLYRESASREFSQLFTNLLKSSYLGSDAERRVWHTRLQAVRRMAEGCRRHGVPFHLVIFPILFELDDYEFGDVEDEIAKRVTAAGIPVFSLTPGFLGHDAASLWVGPYDQHPNEKGHRIAADTLLPYVQSILVELNSGRAAAAGTASAASIDVP